MTSIERGQHTQTSILQRIADALGVSIDAVLMPSDRRSASHDRRQLIERVVEAIEIIEQRGETPSRLAAAEAALEAAIVEEETKTARQNLEPPARKRKRS